MELRFARAPLTLSELLLRMGDDARCEWRLLLRLVDTWVDAGLLVAQGRPRSYLMTAAGLGYSDPPATPAVRATTISRIAPTAPRQRLWTAMRILKRFDLVQLAMAANVSRTHAGNFVRDLTRAGYLRATLHEGGRPVAWASGPRAWGPMAPATVRHADASGSFLRFTDRNTGDRFDVTVRAAPAKEKVNHVC